MAGNPKCPTCGCNQRSCHSIRAGQSFGWHPRYIAYVQLRDEGCIGKLLVANLWHSRGWLGCKILAHGKSFTTHPELRQSTFILPAFAAKYGFSQCDDNIQRHIAMYLLVIIANMVDIRSYDSQRSRYQFSHCVPESVWRNSAPVYCWHVSRIQLGCSETGFVVLKRFFELQISLTLMPMKFIPQTRQYCLCHNQYVPPMTWDWYDSLMPFFRTIKKYEIDANENLPFMPLKNACSIINTSLITMRECYGMGSTI